MNATAKKTITEINRRITNGNAVVLTAQELCDMVRAGKTPSPTEVDVVTTGTCGIMSGTAAVLCFPIAPRDSFRRAERVWLNGVPTEPGPAPNERLGVIDTIVHGTSHSENDPKYGGGHLLRDIVSGKTIEVKVLTSETKIISKNITIHDMTYARLLAIRHAFRNYSAFVNRKQDAPETIFHILPMRGPWKELTFCGCGEINPIQNDPALESIGPGTRCLINGAVGYITGTGTRSTPERPNLSGYADMVGMDVRYMGGFVSSAGPEVISTWAVPIPILGKRSLENAMCTDAKVPLPVADIHDRVPFAELSYADVWQGVDKNIRFIKSECKAMGSVKGGCCTDGKKCPVEEHCPTGAFSISRRGIDKLLCFNCGACTWLCPNDAFRGRLGSVTLGGKKVPIRLRQSNRARAEEAAASLKKRIGRGEFELTSPLEKS